MARVAGGVWTLAAFGVLATIATTSEAGAQVLSDCETLTDWDGNATVASDPVQVGSGSIRWAIADGETLSYQPASPIDMSQRDALRFWMHANHPHALGGNILVYLGSENESTDGIDYYQWQLPIDWTGWREHVLELEYFSTVRTPRGLDQIDEISFRASGWDNTPDTTLVLHVDEVELAMVDRTAPKTTDAELFAAIDLTLPGLEAAQTAVNAGDLSTAKLELCAYFRARTEPAWFFDPHHVDTSVWYDEQRALDAVAGTFTIVGYEYTFPGGVIDWSYNPTLDAPVADNNEWTWQVGRMSFWNDLGRAYWATGDSTYAQAWADQLASFVTTRRVPNVAANGAGSSWRTIDTGIRASGSWSDAWHRFLSAPEFDDDHMILMLKSFYEHGAYLRQFQTSGNWLTHELDGLYTVGALFPEFVDAAEWRAFAVQGMYDLMTEQFLPDGGHYELSPGYHQVSIRHITGLYEVAEVTGRIGEIPEDYLTRLRTAYLWPILIATPDWNNPYVNDSWDVDVARESELPAGLFTDEPVYAWAASGRADGPPPDYTDLILPDSGFVLMRSCWDESAHYAFFDVGPYSRGHSHQDKLNLILWPHGRRLLFDSGGGNYEQSAFRDYGIDTQSHNSVMVDGLPQQRSRDSDTDPLGWGDPNTPAAYFRAEDTHSYAVGYYQDAYGEEDNLVATHRRELLFVRPDLFLAVDALTPNDTASHDYEARWHLLTTNWSEEPGSVTVSTDTEVPNLGIVPLRTEGLTVLHDSGVTDPEVLGWDLDHSGGETPALTVRHQITGTGEQRFVTLLVPLAAGQSNPVVNVQAGSDFDYTVEFDDGTVITFTLAEGEPGIDVVFDPVDSDPIVIDADPTLPPTEPPVGSGSGGAGGASANDAADGSDDEGGCGCTVPASSTGHRWWLLVGVLLGVAAVRGRRRSGDFHHVGPRGFRCERSPLTAEHGAKANPTCASPAQFTGEAKMTANCAKACWAVTPVLSLGSNAGVVTGHAQVLLPGCRMIRGRSCFGTEQAKAIERWRAAYWLMQLPATQASLTPHAIPQPPQLFGSRWVLSMHSPPHST